MGLKPVEFYSISPVEFQLMVDGFRNSRKDRYRQTQYLMFTFAKVMGSNINSPEDIWALDDKEQVEESDDEILKLIRETKSKWQKN